jgi:hypothetical protein
MVCLVLSSARSGIGIVTYESLKMIVTIGYQLRTAKGLNIKATKLSTNPLSILLHLTILPNHGKPARV